VLARVTRWRLTLLHDQFLEAWVGAIPPGYSASEETYLKRWCALLLSYFSPTFSTHCKKC
jgi:hypothetical protein